MLINVSEIMSVPNKVKHIKAPIELQSFKRNGMKYEFIKKEPCNVTITNLGDRKILFEANTKLSLWIPCSRCLTNVECLFLIQFSKHLDFNKTEQARIEELDETNYITGYNLDLDVLIYNEIFLNFPMKVLCQENCKGLCNVCGLDLNKGICNCESTELDPRMATIRDIFNNFKEV